MVLEIGEVVAVRLPIVPVAAIMVRSCPDPFGAIGVEANPISAVCAPDPAARMPISTHRGVHVEII